MQGKMWVESELSKGSKFYFTITSQIGHASREAIASKMLPFQKRTIMFLDSQHDSTGVSDNIHALGLTPWVVHDTAQLANKEAMPHIDTIAVDSLTMVRRVDTYT
jgi:osomolarity two-component system, sensor histidine kinase NIK1